jgi:hypothetical protein
MDTKLRNEDVHSDSIKFDKIPEDTPYGETMMLGYVERI